VYDLIVVGAGPGGYTAALEASREGLRVAVVEKEQVGGTCLNHGCIPTKCLVHDAVLVHEARHADFLTGRQGLGVSMPAVMARKRGVVRRLVGGVEALLKAARVDLHRGEALLAAQGEVTVRRADGADVLRAPNVLLSTGSRPAVPPPLRELFARKDSLVQTTDQALDDETLPQSLLVLGGGVVGVEMAGVYARLGVTVHLVEMLPDILMTEDPDARKAVRRALDSLGVAVLAGRKLARAEAGGRGVLAHVEGPGGERLTIDCARVLCAAGRSPVLPPGSLAARLRLDGPFVAVDAAQRTSLPGVHALGDVTGGLQLAHRASAQGHNLAARLAGKKPPMNLDIVPRCIWGPLEIGAVGQDEQAARQAHPGVLVGRFPFAANGSAQTKGQEAGFVKVLALPDTGRILGVHIVGPGASELIAEAATVMTMEGVVEDLFHAIKPHPTLCESVAEAALDVFGKAVHLPRRK